MTNSFARRAFAATVTAAAVALAGAAVLPATGATAATKTPAAKRKKTAAKKKPTAAAERGAMLHGAGAPRRATGAIGDFYLRTSDRTLYGPKTRRGWGRPTSLAGTPGPQGATGLQGVPGATGVPGTPAFGAAAVTTLPAPTLLSATSDANGDAYAWGVPVATVTLPAGLAFVVIHAQVARSGAWPANAGESWVSCGIPSTAPNLVELYVEQGATTATGFAWSWNSTAVTTQLQCTLGAYFPDGTAGVTLGADLAGTQVALVPVAIPAF